METRKLVEGYIQRDIEIKISAEKQELREQLLATFLYCSQIYYRLSECMKTQDPTI